MYLARMPSILFPGLPARLRPPGHKPAPEPACDGFDGLDLSC